MNRFIIFFFFGLFTVHCKSNPESSESECRGKGDNYIWAGGKCLFKKGKITAAECADILGAIWKADHYECQKPKNLKDCEKSGDNLRWNGEACEDKKLSKNFYLLCIDPDSSNEAKHTLAVLSRRYLSEDKSESCQFVFEKIRLETKLVFHQERIVSCEPFRGLTNLKELDLWNNRIEDLSPLADLKNLEVLKLGHNRIQNISHLKNLQQLVSLYLFENRIKDIAPLSSLDRLEYLDVSFNQIENISGLKSEQYTRGFIKDGNPLLD